MENDVKNLICAGNAQTLVKFLIFGYNHAILEYSPHADRSVFIRPLNSGARGDAALAVHAQRAAPARLRPEPACVNSSA